MKATYVILVPMLLALVAASRPRVAQPATPKSPAASADWSEEAFDADIYPSQQAAAQRVARKWVQQLELASETPRTIRILLDRDLLPAAGEALRSILQAQLPQVHSQVESVRPESLPIPQAGELLVNLRLISLGATPTNGRKTLKLEVAGQSTLLASADYVEKPWVTEPAEANDPTFLERHLVARSTRPCASAAEAHQQAVQNGAAALMERIHTSLLGNRPAFASVDVKWLTQKLVQEIQHGRMIHDRFVQKFERPYGTLYREAILLRLDNTDLNRLISQSQKSIQVRHEASRNSLFSIAGLFAVIYVLYLTLNSFTKGYFRWSLRTTAVVLAIVGLLVLIGLS